MHHDSRQTFWRSEHPLGINKRRSKSFLAEAIRLMTRDADGLIQPFPLVEKSLFTCRQRHNDWWRRDSSFAGPGEPLIQGRKEGTQIGWRGSCETTQVLRFLLQVNHLHFWNRHIFAALFRGRHHASEQGLLAL